MIYLGSDHVGFQLKEEIKTYLEGLSYEYEDLGNKELNPQDDYPDFALLVAKKVAEAGERPARSASRSDADRGILICGTGLGMCAAANKVKGVRAVVAWDQFTAQQSREHLNANILCLGGRTIDIDTAKKIVGIWLKTEFSGEERHKRRLGKIEEMKNG